MTKEAMEKIYGYLGAMDAPNSPWTDEKTLVWAEALRHIPEDLALAAVRRVIATRQWRPSVSEFLDEVLEVRFPSVSETVARESVHAAFRTGNRGQVDPVAMTAVRAMGGWDNAGRMSEAAFTKEFASAYKRALDDWKSAAKIAVVRGDMPLSLDSVRVKEIEGSDDSSWNSKREL